MGNNASGQKVVIPAQIGQRVVRGPDWRWGNQDGGEGHVGTIELLGGEGSKVPKKTVVVQWDSGKQASYRIGAGDAYDLRLFDSAPTGVRHIHVICDACLEDGIIGVRWKCLVCNDYDLCSNCYMNGKHDLSHAFKRMDIPRSQGFDVPKRQGLPRTEARGIFVGAKVMRGPDWMWGNQDGGPGSTGVLVKVTGLNGNPGRSIANVKWNKTDSINVYRFGHTGKLDIKYVEAVSGGYYYKDHLPVLGDPFTSQVSDDPSLIKIGDKVKIELDEDLLKSMQEGHGGWNDGMKPYLGQVGIVHNITPQGDVQVQYEGCNNPWTFHAAAVTKITSGSALTVGSIVRVSDNLELVKKLQDGHGEWIDDMLSSLGKIGKILRIRPDGDLRVKVEGNTWVLNPLCVTLVPGAAVEPVTEEEATDARSSLAQLLVLQHLLERLKTSADSENIVSEAAKGNVETIRRLLKENPEKINEKNNEKTALQVAAYQGHKEVVELLLEANANMELRDDDGDTALHYAAFGNEPEILELLLQKGASVNAINKNGATTLHIAVNKQRVSCVKILIMYNCNVNMQDVIGDTVFHEAIANENLEILDLLLGLGKFNSSLCNKRGFNVLHHAALKGNHLAVERILEKTEILVDAQKDDGFTALHLAALNNHRYVAETLIVKGHCNLNIKNSLDQTSLLLAVRQGHCGVVETLVNGGADVNIGNDDDNTALHMALNKSFSSQTTIRETTDTDAPTIQEILANLRSLKLADVYLAIACYLVQRGADLHFTNNSGKTPMDLIPVPKVKEVIKFYASIKTDEAACLSETPPVQRSISSELGLCTICYEGPATVSFEPCGHKVACVECCIRMKKCIVCQAIILKKLGPGNQLIGNTLLSNPNLNTSLDKVSEPVIEDSQRCLICMDARRNIAFLCGHGACGECAENLQTCHMCRKPITQKINLY